MVCRFDVQAFGEDVPTPAKGNIIRRGQIVQVLMGTLMIVTDISQMNSRPTPQSGRIAWFRTMGRAGCCFRR